MKVESNIPIPPVGSFRAHNQKVIRQMGKGDSILVDTHDEVHNLRRAAIRLGKKVTSRKVAGGIRLWVIA